MEEVEGNAWQWRAMEGCSGRQMEGNGGKWRVGQPQLIWLVLRKSRKVSGVVNYQRVEKLYSSFMLTSDSPISMEILWSINPIELLTDPV